MDDPQVGEEVFYYEWDATTGFHQTYYATIRTILPSPNTKRPRVHLVAREDEKTWNANNIEEIEFHNSMLGQDYWRKRFLTWPPE